MKTRANPTGYGATRGWLWALCAVCSLVIGVGSVWAASPAIAGDTVVEAVDSAGPQSLSLSAPIPTLESAVDPNAPTVVGCPVTALPNDNSTSGNERAPNLRNRFGRSVYLIKATELAAAGITASAPIAFGRRLESIIARAHRSRHVASISGAGRPPSPRSTAATRPDSNPGSQPSPGGQQACGHRVGWRG